MKNIEFSGLETMRFPIAPDIVYILGIEPSGEFIAFYVGQTSRNVGRFGDYIKAQFTASTDFKVGEAVKYFRQRGYEVLVKFKNSADRLKDENEWLTKLKKENSSLLNDLEGYNYKTADIDEERKKVQDYVDNIIDSIKVVH